MAYTQYVRETMPLLAMGTEWENLERAIEEINQYPLKQNAIARLNRELKAGISDEQLAKLVTFLREHIESLGKQERRELESRLGILIGHLLKWNYQSEKRSKSWRATIREQRRAVQKLNSLILTVDRVEKGLVLFC